jgi:hypothetical protein
MTYLVERGEGHATLWTCLHSWDLSDHVFPSTVVAAMPESDPEEWPWPWCMPMIGVYYGDVAVLAKLEELAKKLAEWSFHCDRDVDEFVATPLGAAFNEMFDEVIRNYADEDAETIKQLQSLIDFIDDRKELEKELEA